jgi:hypothetical protein
VLAAALRFQMVKQNANVMAKAKQKAAAAPSARKAKLSDSDEDDELEKSNASSSDDEKVPKKSEKKTKVPEERRAQVINQFTFSVYIKII